MITLSREQIKGLHKKMIETTGGSDGLREDAMLDSALSVAFQTFDGTELYPTTTAKIAGLRMGLFVIIHFQMGISVLELM